MPASSHQHCAAQQSRNRARSRRVRWPLARRGNALTLVVAACVVVGGLALGGWWILGRGSKDPTPQFLLNTVSRGSYDFVVIEQGEVQSASNIELKCEVRSRGGGGSSSGGGGGVTIIDVIPEGTLVQPGDVLVRLDSSSLEQEKVTQQITVNSKQALVIQAENTLAASQIARREYLEGTFVAEEKTILSEEFVAKQALRTAEGQFASAQRLYERGIITALQVEAAKYAVDDAQKKLEVAETKLKNLRDYTKAKMLKQFDSDIATAEALVASETSSYQLELDKLRDIEDQVEKCTIKAPAQGEVVYANEYDSWRGSSQAEFVVAPGTTVRERQAIIRLPNSQDMMVKATVNEARVTLVRPGLPVTIRVDALKDELIQGEVTKVNQYAEAGGWSSGNIKKYATFIKILNPPATLRSGMNAEVRIHVDRREDALQVPVQALAEHKGHFFCLVQNGTKYETREVELASTNDKMAVITTGLAEGDRVVMDPRDAGRLLDLPELPDPLSKVQIAEIPPPPAGQAPITPATLAAAGAGLRVPGIGAAGGEGGGPGGADRGAGGGPPGGGPPGKGKRGGFTPQMIVDRALSENDADKDGKISLAELSTMDDRRKQMLDGADKNSDGFMDKGELLVAASTFAAQMRDRGGKGGQGGPGQGGGGQGGGPAGGGE
jgi:HlyD family secretion protein